MKDFEVNESGVILNPLTIVYKNKKGQHAEVEYAQKANKWYGAKSVSLKWSGCGSGVTFEDYEETFDTADEAVRHYTQKIKDYLQSEIDAKSSYGIDDAISLLKVVDDRSKQPDLFI